MSNGSNPAAVIYDLMCKGGITSYNLTTFNTAAAYWNSMGYGLNMSFNELEELRSMIQKVFNYVDGAVRKNVLTGEWELVAYTPTDTAEDSITTEEFVDFSLTRPSWDQTYNYFIANYTDASADYSQRTIRLPNSAGLKMLGYRRTKTIDLTAFNDVTAASKRMWEIAKQLSYPSASIQFKTSLKYYGLNVGSVVSITNSEYSIVGTDFRIVAKTPRKLTRT